MSLIDEMKAACVFMEKTRVPDGEGGYYTTWSEGAEIMAAITTSNSLETRRAEQEGVTALYTITVNKKAALDYHDVLKRLSDGKIFRVTSNGDDVRTPDRATFQISQVTAEEWKLT